MVKLNARIVREYVGSFASKVFQFKDVITHVTGFPQAA